MTPALQYAEYLSLIALINGTYVQMSVRVYEICTTSCMDIFDGVYMCVCVCAWIMEQQNKASMFSDFSFAHKCYLVPEQSKHLCSFVKASPNDVTESNITRSDRREIIAITFKPIWYLMSHFQLSLLISGLPKMMKWS